MPFYTDERESLITRCMCRINDLFGVGAPAAVVESIRALSNMRRGVTDTENLEELLQWLNNGQNVSCLTLVEQVRKVTPITFCAPTRTKRRIEDVN